MRYYECTNCNLQVSEETAEAIRNKGTHTNAVGGRSANEHTLFCPNISCEDFTLIEREGWPKVVPVTDFHRGEPARGRVAGALPSGEDD
jgi:hypothetical protein